MTRVFVAVLCLLSVGVAGQVPSPQGPTPTPGSPQNRGASRPLVEKLGPNLFGIGKIRIDSARREVSVSGHTNDVTTLEFVANTVDGFKAYESALTVDADAVTFNAALLLIGLDVSHARVPTRHFDPVAPQGDPVDVWVEWQRDNERKRVRVEQLLYDKRTRQAMPEGPWVYTGSSFLNSRFLADMDGVLIGFVHSPSPIIENPRAGAVNAYGSVVYNKDLGLPPKTPVTLVVKASAPARGATQ